MAKKRKASPSFTHYLEARDKSGHMVPFVNGHMVVESLLVELIRVKLPHPDRLDLDRTNFPMKVDMCIALGAIPPRRRDGYLRMNRLRNRAVHELGFAIEFNDAFDLVKSMGESGFDFSDDGVWQSRQWATDNYGTWEIIIECLNSMYFELATDLADLGGPDYSGG